MKRSLFFTSLAGLLGIVEGFLGSTTNEEVRVIRVFRS